METKKLLSFALGAMMLCPGLKAGFNDACGAVLAIDATLLSLFTVVGIVATIDNERIYQSGYEKEKREIAQKKVAAGEWVEGEESGGLVHQKRYYDVNKDVKNTDREERAQIQYSSRWYSAPLSIFIPVLALGAGVCTKLSMAVLSSGKGAEHGCGDSYSDLKMGQGHDDSTGGE